MSPAHQPLTAAAFDGDVTGMSLPDVIQLNTQNRVSGCVTVQHGEKKGLIFLREGEIIHAEQGDLTGQEAFYEILAWPAGRFTVQRNVTTTRSTIHQSWQHLLMETACVIDERRAGIRQAPPPLPKEPPSISGDAGTVVEKLRSLPGVAYAVAQSKDGVREGDDSYEAELLAGQAMYLAMLANQLGETFRAGEIASATVQARTQHLLLVADRHHLVSVLVDGKQLIGPVEAAARAALAAHS